MNVEDVHTLSGAYALDALPPVEREEFTRHLDRCEACAREVRELSETAARLARAVAVPPPPQLRENVMRRIATVRQDPPPGALRALRRRTRRVLPGFALAAALAAAVLGGTTVWQWQQAQDAREHSRHAQQQSALLAQVLSAPDARIAAGELPGGGTGTVVVSAEADRAAFVASGMPSPPDGMVYQLWFDDHGAMRPAGLMDPGSPDEAVLMEGALEGATGMGITVEPAGGSPQPTSDPLAVMEFPTT
ncbi:anti-sigma factor [Streptomyces xiamenensis]|uniref:Regulator of SigK n=1 Tax=Streptomyces xiamenensis TaxID=408015 RepID=A0A0F7FZU5_9ACTN|nr:MULTISPECIES: anti-sigma factor [Streptomyces]AKG46242.1 anti-sigma-k factor [Streptomyces xiamenensis]